MRDYGTPPLVWGGEPEHAHEWAEKVLRVERGAGNWTQAANGTELRTGMHQTRFKGDVVAARANTEYADVTTGFCSCGAWLGSLGLEPSPDLYIEHIVEVFRHVRSVLRDDGTLWLNLGDSYAGSGKGPSNSVKPSNPHSHEASKPTHRGLNNLQDTPTSWIPLQRVGPQEHTIGVGRVHGYKPKDLMMMPARVALALQADGWYLRSVIPWLKRNCMPESTTDRPTTAVEYVFLFSKSRRYYWDAEAVRATSEPWSTKKPDGWDTGPGAHNSFHRNGREAGINTGEIRNGRNRRNADWFLESWQGLMLDEEDEPIAFVVNPQPFSGAHFATFPPRLVEPMVKASTSEKGQCPECGAPWIRVVDAGERVRQTNGTTGAQASIAPRGGVGSTSVLRDGKIRTRSAVGWRSTCAHTAEPVPCVVLDPFSGSGTVGLVADRLGRDAVLCELSETYTPMGTARIRNDAPMFAQVVAD